MKVGMIVSLTPAGWTSQPRVLDYQLSIRAKRKGVLLVVEISDNGWVHVSFYYQGRIYYDVVGSTVYNHYSK